jgi:hypothetical protein
MLDISRDPYSYTEKDFPLPVPDKQLTPKQFGQLRDNMSRFKRNKGKRK